jgi:hypothetical protein
MKLPQLSLRELFLLVALVAMGCGWWVRDSQQAALARQLQAKVEQAEQGRRGAEQQLQKAEAQVDEYIQTLSDRVPGWHLFPAERR